MLFYTPLHQVVDIHPAVGKPALYRRLFPFVHDITVDVTNLSQAGHHAGAVWIAESPCHRVDFIEVCINGVIFFELAAYGLDIPHSVPVVVMMNRHVYILHNRSLHLSFGNRRFFCVKHKFSQG